MIKMSNPVLLPMGYLYSDKDHISDFFDQQEPRDNLTQCQYSYWSKKTPKFDLHYNIAIHALKLNHDELTNDYDLQSELPLSVANF